jgi:CheY-like chemotaxis protein
MVNTATATAEVFEEIFLVSCAACGKAYDAAQAEWCKCVTAKIATICPHCSACICKAPGPAQFEFWFLAPEWFLWRRDEELRRRKAAQAARPQHLVKVLVVDDDDEIRFIAAYAIEEMGYTVVTASNAEEAMSIVKKESPAIVLTDALMPRTDGRELCKTIKIHDPWIRVVVMSSLYTSRRYATEAHRVFHADEYLPKPIDFHRLKGVIQRLAHGPQGAAR